MFFETRVEPPATSAAFHASAEAFVAGRVREARRLSAARAVDAGDALLCIDILRAEARPRRAMALARRAARLFPESPLVLLEAARASIAVSQLKRAESFLMRVGGDAAMATRVAALRALAAAAAGKDEDARVFSLRATASGDPVVEHDLAAAALLRADLDAAIEHLKRARTLAPRFCRAGLALGEALACTGRLDDAERVLTDVAERSDEDADVDLTLIAVDLLRGSTQRAHTALDVAVLKWDVLRRVRDPQSFATRRLAGALAVAARSFAAHGKDADAERIRALVAALAAAPTPSAPVAPVAPVAPIAVPVAVPVAAPIVAPLAPPSLPPRAPALPSSSTAASSSVPVSDETQPLAPSPRAGPGLENTAPGVPERAAPSSETQPDMVAPKSSTTEDAQPAVADAPPAATKDPVKDLDADWQWKPRPEDATQPRRPRPISSDTGEEVPSAAADWSGSRVEGAKIIAPPPKKKPEKPEKPEEPAAPPPAGTRRLLVAAGVAVVVIAVVVVARIEWTPPAPSTPVAHPDASTPEPLPTTTAAANSAETFVARARACGVALPTTFVLGRPVEELHPGACAPLPRMLKKPDDDRIAGWRGCVFDDDGKRSAVALVKKNGKTAGAALLFNTGESRAVADLFPSRIEFGALYPSAEKATGRDQAVFSEADCDGTALVVHAACPRLLLHFTTEKGERMANPAPWPGCRVQSIYVVDGAL